MEQLPIGFSHIHQQHHYNNQTSLILPETHSSQHGSSLQIPKLLIPANATARDCDDVLQLLFH